jgi:hypothetical protein
LKLRHEGTRLMKTFISVSTALVLALGVSQASLAQGKGKGGGNDDKERGAQGQGGPGKARAADDDGGGKGRGKGNSGGGGADRAERAERGGGPDKVTVRQGGPPDDRGKGQARRAERNDVVVVPGVDTRGRGKDRGDDVVVIRGQVREGRGLIAGCPPGLAKRNNGCLPPGQERKLLRARYDNLFGRSDPYSYRFDDGYMYRYDRQGGLLGYLPALGGALGVGNPWPVQYSYEPAPRYYVDYYRMRDPYDYRYADGAIYAVDPQTQAIQNVVALLTGQPLNVGQRMPQGYDVYNVPYDYRDRYYDTPDMRYRYNDGYVYRVDPTTQLVTAIIQLLV